MHLRQIASRQFILTLGSGTQILFIWETPSAAYIEGLGFLYARIPHNDRWDTLVRKYVGNFLDSVPGARHIEVPRATLEALLP